MICDVHRRMIVTFAVISFGVAWSHRLAGFHFNLETSRTTRMAEGDAMISFDGGLRLVVSTPRAQVAVGLSKAAAQVLLEHIRTAVRDEPPPNIRKYAQIKRITCSEREVMDVLKSRRAADEYAARPVSRGRKSARTGSVKLTRR